MPIELSEHVLAWGAELIDPKTVAQAHNTARLPFVVGPVALMPDAHFGMGATVGSVIATEGAVIPAAVGVDIGCGMAACKLGWREDGTVRVVGLDDLPESLGRVHGAIRGAIPSGVGKARDDIRAGSNWVHAPGRVMPELLAEDGKQLAKASAQFGTLGSGNHFVELCADEHGHVWLVLHSGSRGVGKTLAEVHIGKAKGLMRQWSIHLDDPDLAYLAQGTPEFDAYIRDMLWAQDYAAGNRAAMLNAAVPAIGEQLGLKLMTAATVNCHHNFTQMEHHKGRDLWVTRKGAIRARKGDLGIIPGSMATGSFIVQGRGNPSSWMSCSHGAGRTMSRGQAKRELSPESLTDRMAGIAWNDRDAQALVDEHPSAYKDLGAVMAAQADLVEPLHRLQTILNYKGVS